jgi:hypothetical protein
VIRLVKIGGGQSSGGLNGIVERVCSEGGIAMKSLTVWSFALLMLAIAVVGQESSNSGSTEQQIRSLAKDGKEATLKNDASWLEKNTTSDYTAVLAVGGVLPRHEIIAERKSGHFKYASIDVSDQRVRTYGNTAILNETADIKASHNDHDISGRYYMTQVWVKQAGGWKLANLQSTKAQP